MTVTSTASNPSTTSASGTALSATTIYILAGVGALVVIVLGFVCMSSPKDDKKEKSLGTSEVGVFSRYERTANYL